LRGRWADGRRGLKHTQDAPYLLGAERAVAAAGGSARHATVQVGPGIRGQAIEDRTMGRCEVPGPFVPLQLAFAQAQGRRVGVAVLASARRPGGVGVEGSEQPAEQGLRQVRMLGGEHHAGYMGMDALIGP